MTDKERYGFDVEREMRHLKGIVEKNDTLTISNRFTRYLIEQAERVQELERFKEYFDELYGQGLEVAEWHMNGDLELFDNFYEGAIENMDGDDE